MGAKRRERVPRNSGWSPRDPSCGRGAGGGGGGGQTFPLESCGGRLTAWLKPSRAWPCPRDPRLSTQRGRNGPRVATGMHGARRGACSVLAGAVGLVRAKMRRTWTACEQKKRGGAPAGRHSSASLRPDTPTPAACQFHQSNRPTHRFGRRLEASEVLGECRRRWVTLSLSLRRHFRP